MIEMTLKELADKLGGELVGDGERMVRAVGSLESAGADEVTFLANVRYEKYMADTRAVAVIVATDYAGAGESLIRCEDPYFAFRNAMIMFCGFRQPHFEGIDPRTNIDPTAELADDVRVGAFVTIAAHCRIGKGSAIYPGVYIGPNCRIGRDCAVYPNVTLYDGCVLGDRVTIHAGSSIGQDGFGYATHDGKHEKIPHAGWVELQDDVEIGACCAIDRATIGATIVGAGTKFSNGVVIGHGTKLGRHCLLAAQSGIAGSTVVGDHCILGAQSGAVGHIRIGDRVRVGAQAGVNNNVPPGQDLLGSPVMPLAQARRALRTLPRLPDLRKAVRRLTRELSALKSRINGRAGSDQTDEDKP